MTDDLQARLEQALRDFHRYEGLCPDEGQPLERDRECSACQALVMMTDVLRELLALRRVRDQLRDDVSVGRVKLVDECRELSEACREADKARVP